MVRSSGKAKIEDTIRIVEGTTSAEFVVALVIAPGIYWGYLLACVLTLGALVTTGFYFYAPWPDWETAASFALISMSLVMLCLLHFRLLHRLVPASVKFGHLRHLADYLFRKTGLADLPDKNGVLLLVMRDEHMVHVAAGPGLLELTGNNAWQEIIDRFVRNARAEDPQEAVCGAIRDFGLLLQRHFPSEGRKLNLVPDRLIII